MKHHRNSTFVSLVAALALQVKWRLLVLSVLVVSLSPQIAPANIPGGGTGSGPPVTVADNGDGTVTLANGLVSILIVKSNARLNSVMYTHKSGGSVHTSEVLKGKGEYYYGGFSLGSGTFEYSLATDPVTPASMPM
jgi:hypothetical protein